MEFNKIKEMENKYSIGFRQRQNICLVRGIGNKLYDTNGKEYVDFVSGNGENCLGYCDEEITDAIHSQSKMLLACSNLYYNETQSLFGKALCEGTPFGKTFFCSGSLEAGVVCIAMIHRYVKHTRDPRRTILYSTSNVPMLRQATTPGLNTSFRMRAVDGKTFEEFREALTDDVCAVIFEPIHCSDEVRFATYDDMLRCYALAKARGVLIVIDETKVGIGRTGNMFAYDSYGIQPDMVALQRGLGGGIPIGALLARREISDALGESDILTEYTTNTLAYATGKLVINRLKSGLLEEIAAKGQYLIEQLSRLNKYNFVSSTCAQGLIGGIKLTGKVNAHMVVGLAEKHGLLLSALGNTTVKICPPYTITQGEIAMLINVLDEMFSNINV